jgi:hypothetical protein
MIGACLASAAVAQPIAKLATIGDSYTDEYSDSGYGSYARGWTQLLAQYRGISMGPDAFTAGVYDWGEPRRGGFEDCWARAGAQTNDALANQVGGVVTGLNSRGVSHVAIFVGGNDFAPWFDHYQPIYYNTMTPGEVNAYVAGRLANITAILNQLPQGTKVVLASVMDFSALPYVWEGGEFWSVPDRERVNAAVVQLNNGLRDLAQARRLVFLDMHALGKTLWGPNNNLRHFVSIGNRQVNLWGRNSGTQPLSGWVEDGIHPDTIIQHIFANAFMAAFNVGFDTGLAPFTEQQMLVNVGRTYGGSDTLAPVIGPYEQYVQDYSCDIDFNNDGIFPDNQDISDFVLQFAGAECASCDGLDFNGDGIFPDNADFEAYLTVMAGAPCSSN